MGKWAEVRARAFAIEPNGRLLLLGILLVVAAVVGGGLKAADVELPIIDSPARQLGLAAFGLGVMAIAFLVGSPKPGLPAKSPGFRRLRRRLDAAMPAETPLDQPVEVRAQIVGVNAEGLAAHVAAEAGSPGEIEVDDVRRGPLPVLFPIGADATVGPASIALDVTTSAFRNETGTQHVQLSPTGDSGIVTFVLHPLGAASTAIVVVRATQIRPESGVIGTVSLRTRITETSRPEVPWVVSRAVLGGLPWREWLTWLPLEDDTIGFAPSLSVRRLVLLVLTAVAVVVGGVGWGIYALITKLLD